jgi:hypothetical protein
MPVESRAAQLGGRSGGQSSRRSLPINLLWRANTRRPQRNCAPSSHRKSPLASSSAMELSDVSTGSRERQRSFPLSSLGTGGKRTDDRPLTRVRKLTNEGPSDAKSRPLLGKSLISSCWTVPLRNSASIRRITRVTKRQTAKKGRAKSLHEGDEALGLLLRLSTDHNMTPLDPNFRFATGVIGRPPGPLTRSP